MCIAVNERPKENVVRWIWIYLLNLLYLLLFYLDRHFNEVYFFADQTQTADV